MPTESDISDYQNDSETDTKSIVDSMETNGAGNGTNGQICGSKLPTGTFDPTPYVQRARVTKPAPPKPSYNPMQFVQIKPCSLYQQAQTQIKKVEEVKKVQEIKKEEPEDWQNNLDNWKSSRRKRVEHIIDRVVEVKKLELEEHDRNRRKSKTFSEMLEERGDRKGRVNKLASLAVYTEDDANDLSDFGIGTSSASGKSSLSEDYDSVTSDNIETEKHDIDNLHLPNIDHGASTRDYISSPGYDTSSSTAPASSPDPCEYTYEGAIQDYKQRISRATSSSYNNSNGLMRSYSKDSTPERTVNDYTPRRLSSSKIEDRLMNFELKSANEINDCTTCAIKKDLPKVDILKRRELFEKDQPNSKNDKKRLSGDFIPNSKLIRDRVSSIEKNKDDSKKIARISTGDISSIQNRLHCLENKQNEKEPATNSQKPNTVLPVSISIKDRMSSLQNAVATKEEIKKGPVQLIDEHELEVLKLEQQKALQTKQNVTKNLIEESNQNDTDHEDSGIHTTDVSCSVSQTEEQVENVNEENHHINVDSLLVEKKNTEKNINHPTSLSPEVEEISSATPEHDFELSVSESSLSIASQIQNNSLSVVEGSVVIINDNKNFECKNNIGDGNNVVNTSIRNNLKLNNLDSNTPNALTPSLSSPSSPCSPRGYYNDIFEDELTGRNVICVINSKSTPAPSQVSPKVTTKNISPKSQQTLSPIEKINITNSKEPPAQVSELKLLKKSKDEERFLEEQPITEDICDKIDINKLVNNGHFTATPYFEISLADIAQCEKNKVPIQNNNRNDNNNLISQAKRYDSKSPDRSRLLDFVQKETSTEKEKKAFLPNSELQVITNSTVITSPSKTSPKPALSPKPKIIPQKPLGIKIKVAREENKESNSAINSPKNNLKYEMASPQISEPTKKTDETNSNSNEFRYSLDSQNSDLSIQTVIEADSPLNKNDLTNKQNITDLLDNSEEAGFSAPLGESSYPSSDSHSLTEKPKSSGGVLVAKLEIVETTIKVRSNESSPVTPRKLFVDELSTSSPTINSDTHPNAKPINIFDFIKKNFNNESNNENEQSDLNLDNNILTLGHSKFYVPSPSPTNNTHNPDNVVIDIPSNIPSNEVNIEITKVFKTENIVEKLDNVNNETDMTSKINELLDKKITKLTAEDSRM